MESTEASSLKPLTVCLDSTLIPSTLPKLVITESVSPSAIKLKSLFGEILRRGRTAMELSNFSSSGSGSGSVLISTGV